MGKRLRLTRGSSSLLHDRLLEAGRMTVEHALSAKCRIVNRLLGRVRSGDQTTVCRPQGEREKADAARKLQTTNILNPHRVRITRLEIIHGLSTRAVRERLKPQTLTPPQVSEHLLRAIDRGLSDTPREVKDRRRFKMWSHSMCRGRQRRLRFQIHRRPRLLRACQRIRC